MSMYPYSTTVPSLQDVLVPETLLKVRRSIFVAVSHGGTSAPAGGWVNGALADMICYMFTEAQVD